ncbi:MAG TPA: response regulator [Trueperaceae bacterium]|nr:response regulator [Trueperaceae bacterium]
MIEGSLRNVPLSDVFQVIATGQKSGVLTVQRGLARARIYFTMGRIEYAHVTPGVHLGEILVRMDILTAHEVQEILRRQHTENAGTQLGLMAVEMGLVREDDLRLALERQILEVVGDLLSWSEGRFDFTDRAVKSSQAPTDHSIDALMLLMRVAQRRHEFDQVDVEPSTVYVRQGDPTRVEMPTGGWEVLGYVDGKRSARSVAAELDLTERHVFHLLTELSRLGVLEKAPFTVEDPVVLVVSPSSALQRLIRLALQRAGFRVESVFEYSEAEAAIDTHHPSAMVVDDDKAGTAWELVRELRKRPGHAHLQVLLLLDEVPKSGLFRRLPRAETLLKPFHELRLQELVSQLVGRPAT